MRLINLELVFRNGSTPVTKSPTAQTTRVTKGEDVTFRLTCFNEDGSVRDITGHTFTLGIVADAQGLSVVVRSAGSIDGAPSLGVALAELSASDTAPFIPDTYYLSVAVSDGTNDWQPIPRSTVVLLPTAAIPSV